MPKSQEQGIGKLARIVEPTPPSSCSNGTDEKLNEIKEVQDNVLKKLDELKKQLDTVTGLETELKAALENHGPENNDTNNRSGRQFNSNENDGDYNSKMIDEDGADPNKKIDENKSDDNMMKDNIDPSQEGVLKFLAANADQAIVKLRLKVDGLVSELDRQFKNDSTEVWPKFNELTKLIENINVLASLDSLNKET